MEAIISHQYFKLGKTCQAWGEGRATGGRSEGESQRGVRCDEGTKARITRVTKRGEEKI